MNQRMQNEILIFIVIFSNVLVLGYSRDTTTKQKELIQNGNLVCNGEIRAKSLTISLNKDFYADNAEMEIVHSNEINTSKLNTKKILTSVILANNKMNMLFINSFLKVKGQISYGNKDRKADDGTSFIQLGPENIYLNNIRQWKLVKELDVSMINYELNNFIRNVLLFDLEKKQKKNAVGNQIEIVKNLNTEISSKLFKNFDHILIETNYKFVNYIWNGNTAYIKINDNLYWMDHHEFNDNNENGLQCDTNNWNTPIRIVIPKNIIKMSKTQNNSITITFGIKLSDNLNREKLKFTDCPVIISILNKNEGIKFENFHISLK